jgi:hypothetical protein
MYGRNPAAQAGRRKPVQCAIRRPCRPPPEQGMNARRFRHTAGARAGGAPKSEGGASNRSREGPHPSSSGRWPAERGRRRARAARLARSKGPPAPRDDDGREQKGNFARPRSRPHVLISAPAQSHRPRYPAADCDGADSVRAGACAGEGRCRKKNPAEGGAQVLGRTNSEGRRVRSANSNAQSRAGFRGFQKKIFGGGPPR